MKKVLIISNYIWPYHTGGSNVVHPLAKYLPECGWEPIVLTAPLPENVELGYRVIQVPYKDMLATGLKWLGFDTTQSIKKQVSKKLNITTKKSFLDYIFLRLSEVLTYPAADKGWISPAGKIASEIIEKEDIMVIIGALPSIMGVILANELKKKYNIPWVVWCYHLWSENNAYPYGSIRRWFDKRLEIKTLKSADVLVTSSEPLAEKLRKLHKGKKIIITSQGYHPDSINDPPSKLTKKFTITYTGSFSVGLREPTTLLHALHNLFSQGIIDREDIEVRFYGPEEIWMDSEVENLGLSGIVKQYGRVPMEVALEKQKESQVLFNPKWDDPEEPGIYSGKIYEYLAAKRPILATGKYKDVVDEFLSEIGAGVSCLSVETTEKVLVDMYKEYKENGEVIYKGDDLKIKRFSYHEIVKTYSNILNDLVGDYE